jgi:molecular chaperone GrpE
VVDETRDSSGNEENEQGNGASGPTEPAHEAVVAVEEEPSEVDPIAVAQAEVARIRDQLLRTAADFDNFRKRSRRELADGERRSREDTLRDLLPVFDNLERAAAHAETATDVKSLADGVTMVLRQFLDTLSKLGVERVQAVGLPFDPAQHEAIQHMGTTEHPPGTVVHEVQAGYRAGDHLVRPAMVVVAKAPSGS